MSTLGIITDAIGGDATDKLVEDFAGTRIYVPQVPRSDDPLSLSIGLDAAQKLAQIYGGDRMDVPNPVYRRNEIVALRATGLSIEAIARQSHCTTRRVYQVLADSRRPKTGARIWNSTGRNWNGNGALRPEIGGDGTSARKIP